MPFPNEHAARLINPKSLNPIRVRRTKGSGKGTVKGVKIPNSIEVIWFVIRREGSEVPVAQALRFPKSTWTEKEARKWLTDKKIKPILFEPASAKKKKEIQKLHKLFHTLWGLGDDSLELITNRGAVKKGHDLTAEEMIIAGMEHGSILVLENVEKKDADEDEKNVHEIIEHILSETKPEFTLDPIEEPEEEKETETKPETDKETFAYETPILKVDKEERMVYGVVLEPETVDAQKDFVTAAEIRKTAHDFMENTQKIGLQHEDFKKKFKIMESYIAPEDFQVGKTTVKKGSWLLAVRVISNDVWKKVKKGEITGFSIGGEGTRVSKN
jgi:hypothetical protein